METHGSRPEKTHGNGSVDVSGSLVPSDQQICQDQTKDGDPESNRVIEGHK